MFKFKKEILRFPWSDLSLIFQYLSWQHLGLRRFVWEVWIISVLADNFCSGQLFVVFCETGMSSHLIIVQGLNLTENYQSTNQDKKDKILSYKTASTTVISVMLCRGSVIWFRNFLVHTEVLNGSLEKRSTICVE